VLAKGALATGAARKKAIVAVARQLAVDLWRIRTGRLNPEQLGPKYLTNEFEGNRKEPKERSSNTFHSTITRFGT
jgi:hypothetical protein